MGRAVSSMDGPRLPAVAAATAAATTASTAASTAVAVVATATTAATTVTTTAATPVATATAAVAAATTTEATTAAAEAAATTAASALLTLLGLVHAERPTVEGTTIHPLDCLGGFLGGSHGHESKAAGTAGLAIRDQVDIIDESELLERRTDALCVGVER
jgi:hypothetical protein